jgi:hypothetical protein
MVALKGSLLQLCLPLLGAHLITLSFSLSGKMDSYTMTFMIHQTLLVCGAQLVHLGKYYRKSRHRWLFAANILWTTVEVLFSTWGTSWTNRNGNFCPELSEAIAAAQQERTAWTMAPLFLSILFLTVDVIASWSDSQYAAKNIPPGSKKKVPPEEAFLSPNLLWKKKTWNVRRWLYIGFGIGIYAFSIWNVEVRIIAHFHEKMQNVPGLSSAENGWTAGQILAFLVCVIVTGITTRSGCIKICKEFAQKMFEGQCPSLHVRSQSFRSERG